jgi:hypothetical protein
MKGIDMFTVAGVSRKGGVIKVRFCSDKILRIKNLQKQGDTDIDLIDLPNPMSKPEACQFLLDTDQFTAYVTEIIEILGKKELIKSVKQPIISVVKEEKVDLELESIKELAEA